MPEPKTNPLPSDERLRMSIALMSAFADRTGLASEQPNKRYLWTDAFAVCNFLGLARATGDPRYGELAQRLVDRVHHSLGQHRPDESAKGWLSGLSGAEAEAHPTRGGLRIGKDLPERKPNERFDPELEWDRDGQYFHYLTKWMHALDQSARATRNPAQNLWARELADVAHRAFVVKLHGRATRMVWKMSIDLSHPLVASMGQHDPLDGLVTYSELEATRARLAPQSAGPELAPAIADFRALLEAEELATTDPLGIGGLLADAARVAALERIHALPDAGLRERLLRAARSGLELYAQSGELDEPADARLAFRELGLAIGIEAVASIDPGLFARFGPLAERIIGFWVDEKNQRARTWREHRDIDEVMLATALVPAGFVELNP